MFAVGKLCDPHLSASEVSFLLWGAIQMSVLTFLPYSMVIVRCCPLQYLIMPSCYLFRDHQATITFPLAGVDALAMCTVGG